MYSRQLRALGNVWVTKETKRLNNMATLANNYAEETVALAWRELALSHGDQQGLSEFLTEYFTPVSHVFTSGK